MDGLAEGVQEYIRRERLGDVTGGAEREGLEEGLQGAFEEGSNDGFDKELRIGFQEGCKRRGF